MYKGFTKKQEANKLIKAQQSSKKKKSTSSKKKNIVEEVKSTVKKGLGTDIVKDLAKKHEKELANSKVGQAVTGVGKGLVDTSLPGTAYSIVKGKKLSDTKALNPNGKYPEATKKSKKARSYGNIAGNMLGYASGYKAVEKGTAKLAGKALASKAGKKATEKAVASKVGKKLGEKATKKIVNSAAKDIAADATIGTVLDLGLARGEGKKGKELAKDMAANAALNVVTGGVVEGVSGAKSLLNAKKAAKGAKNEAKGAKNVAEAAENVSKKAKNAAENVADNTGVNLKTAPPKKGAKQADLKAKQKAARKQKQIANAEKTKASEKLSKELADYVDTVTPTNKKPTVRKGNGIDALKNDKSFNSYMADTHGDIYSIENKARKNGQTVNEFINDEYKNYKFAPDEIKANYLNSDKTVADLTSKTGEIKDSERKLFANHLQQKYGAIDNARQAAKSQGMDFDSFLRKEKVEYDRTVSANKAQTQVKPPTKSTKQQTVRNVQSKVAPPIKEAPSNMNVMQGKTLKDLGADVARPNQTIKDAKAKYGSYDGNIPLETNMGRVTQGAKTMYNSPIADKKMRDAIKSGVEDGSYWTRKMSNKDSLRAASEKIRTNGLEDETKSFLNLARDNREVRGEDIAMGYQLANEHIARGNYEAAQSVLSDVCQMESEAGRALQAMRLFNSLSPEGRVKSAIRSAEKVSKHTGYDVKVSDEMLDALRNATDEELPNIKKEINKELWNQIPASFAEKLTEWRYFAMLGNPRTHIRNIVGNALYVPVVRMDNVIQTGLEKAFSNKLDALGGRKTTAILTGSKSDRELKKFAGEQFDELKKMLDGGNGKYNEEYRPQYARTFKSNAMEGLINFNSNAFELEDQLFMKLGYDSAFAQYCKANGKKVSDLTDDFIKEASDYAYNEALRATYRDPSRLADALSKFRKRLDVKATDTMGTKALKTTGKIVMDSALPFTKTPINILKRGVSHSPLGLAKGIAEIATAKDARSLQKAITQVAEGLTGTGVVALGMYMGGKGYANGSLGEYNNEYKWQQLLGKQDYALNVGDYSITMDWAAPICMPFFVGVELGNSMLKENANIWDGIESLSSIYEPVLEMSMLSGVQNLFDFANGESKDIVTFMGNAAQNLGNQFIPTLVGQIARTAVPERKIALSTAENSLQRNVEKYIDKTENKIPGLTNTNQSFVDMFGRTDSKNSPMDYVKAGLENFLSPAYISKRNDGAVETELESLRQSLGSEGKEVLPTDYSSNYDIRYEGKDYRMNEDQFTGYKKERGQDTYRLLGELFNSASYKKMSDSQKRDAIKKVYEQAGEESKRSQVISMGIATERQYDYGTLNKAQKALVDSGTFTTSEIKKANKLVEKTGATTSAAKAYALANSGMSEKKVAAYTSKNAVETAGKLKMAGATQKDVVKCAKILKNSGAKKSIAKAYALLDGGQKPSIVSALVSDGAVNRASAIKSAGITPEMLDQVADLIDTNGNNHYSNEELYSFLNNFKASRSQKRAIFEALKSSPKTANPY